MSETKICKYCKTEIPKDAKICPNCRKKQKGKLGIIIAAVVILLIIGGVAGGGAGKDTSSEAVVKTQTSSKNTADDAAEASPAETEQPIEYLSVSKEELSDALLANALKAADTYKDKYLEVSGYLNVIDSSGKYISINSGDGDYSLVSVTCNIKNDDQKTTIMNLNKGDALTIKGKCTDVGEVLGYQINIDEITVN